MFMVTVSESATSGRSAAKAERPLLVDGVEHHRTQLPSDSKRFNWYTGKANGSGGSFVR